MTRPDDPPPGRTYHQFPPLRPQDEIDRGRRLDFRLPWLLTVGAGFAVTLALAASCALQGPF
ncbi:MAG: hypothetical protein MUE98_00305 [Rhodobacteraceae bacterium]|jgi:hypothetical protein|nr:hypothetical protein [Paracoccaceae bacterium]